MSLKLYTYPGNPNAVKAMVAAEFVGVTIDVPPFAFGVDNKTPEFLKMNPNGKVPVLETPEGCIFESNAIARYIARLRPDVGLYGRTFIQSGQVDAWVDWCANELSVPLSLWLFTYMGFIAPNPQAIAKAKNDAKSALAVLENYLMSRTFIVGDRVTLADVVVVSTLLYPFKFLLDPEWHTAFPCVMRYFRTCVNQPHFRAVVGEVALCTAAPEVAPAAAAAGKKEKKEKKKKGGDQAQPAKKAAAEEPAEEPASSAVQAAAASAADDMPAEEKKAPHPLSMLPKSPMVLDAWKKAYSNSKEDFYASMDTFWQMYDPEGYSLWVCEYNYNSDNKVEFMTSNLLSGFVQRCDELRKFAFGTLLSLHNEAEGRFDVSGCFLLRGDDIKHMLEANPDAEYYTWTRITELDDAAKKRVADLWCATDSLDGKRVSDSKVFK